MKMKPAYTFGLTFVLALTMLAACDQVATRHFGGTTRIELPCGQKFVNASWKNDNSIWYAVRPATIGEQYVTVTYKESSNFGFVQGTVYFLERPCT
jgi:hypothetical protein